MRTRKGNIRYYMVGNDAFGKQRLLTEMTQKHNPNYEHVMTALLRHANQFHFTKRACIKWRDDHWQD